MSKVYAPQQPSRFDLTTRLWIPTMNMQAAEKFGELVVLLPPNANRLHTAPLLVSLKERMEHFTAEDWLVAVGDPSLIAAAACIAVRKTGGLLRLLKWDRMSSDYLATEMRL
jgi:hypothetical protein